MMLWLLLLAAALVLGYWLHWRWTHRRMLELAEKVPGPPTLPIFGNSLLLINPAEQMSNLAKLTQKYGDYLRIWLGPDLNIFVKNPADIRLLLTSSKTNQKGRTYEMMKKAIGPGIITGGACWRAHRKLATPFYSKKRAQDHEAIFNREAEELVKILRCKDPEVAIDAYIDTVWATTMAFCQTMMGCSREETPTLKRLEEVVYSSEEIYRHVYSKMTKWWLSIPFVFWLLGEKKFEDNYLKVLDELSSDIVNRRKKVLSTKEVNEESMCIVDRFITSGELSEQEIKWETFSVFTTSQEPSAKVTAGILMLLAHLPEWQEKVYNEIIEVLGPKDEAVSVDQLKDLPYLDMVYKETLRFFSIAPLIQRTLEDEITINDGKITLPAGTSLIIPIHDVHRDLRYWEQPHRAMPERFLPENVSKRDLNAFIPFSLGAMNCLGQVYAAAIIKIFTIRILRQIQLEGCGDIDNIPIEVVVSVTPTDGYRVKVRPRKTVT